jgi:hypothetical protein
VAFFVLCVGVGVIHFPTTLESLKNVSFLVWRVFLLWLWVGKVLLSHWYVEFMYRWEAEFGKHVW